MTFVCFPVHSQLLLWCTETVTDGYIEPPSPSQKYLDPFDIFLIRCIYVLTFGVYVTILYSGKQSACKHIFNYDIEKQHACFFVKDYWME